MRELTLSEKSSSSSRFGASKDDQKSALQKLGEKALRVGDKWYLIDADWYTKWLNYIGVKYDDSLQYPSIVSSTSEQSSCPAPDKINNKALLVFNPVTKTYHLKESLVEEIEYYTLSEELWNYLVQLYEISRPEVIFSSDELAVFFC
jgi:hypothetical protein